jgi:hypothetical protein
MKAASNALISLLAENQFYVADLYTLTLLDNTIYRFTSHDLDLSYGGHVFTSTDLIFVRGRIKRAIGFKVDVMTLDIHSDGAHLMSGLPFLPFAHNGGLDGARLLLQRAFMPANAPTDTSGGVLHGFEGMLQINELTRDTVRMEVRSDMERLNVMMPRNVYQPSCGNSLFDAGCGLSKGAFEIAGTVSLDSTSLRSVATGMGQAAGYFNGGTLRFTSGANAGALSTILNHVSGVFTLMRPLNAAVHAGDAVVACPGCARTVAACAAFGNLANFRGQPFVPTPETAL